MKMDTGFAADIIFGNIYILTLYSNKCTSFIFYMGPGNKCRYWMYQSLKNYYLQSPNYPLNYNNNLRCEWIITAYENHSITLQFHNFNVHI